MRCIISSSNNPYFNLATEEYFLRNSDSDLFLLYINEPCIVAGKHQNILSEINLGFALKQKLSLARRISGGGTVYQDSNNLNFSFIHNCVNLEKINFQRFTYPVLEALKDFGLPVEFSGRNDLLLGDKKISGNAMHIFKNRVLSHGTLLYNSDLKRLSESLRNNPDRYIDKSIKSVRSKVTNISDYSDNKQSISDFTKFIYTNITKKFESPDYMPLNGLETAQIEQLVKDKYETWEWIFGYSPKYTFKNSLQLSGKFVHFEIEVEKGIIRKIKTDSEINDDPVYRSIFEILNNSRHDFGEIVKLFEENIILIRNTKYSITEFCNLLF
jgi:lipoate---protein ligase